MKRTFLAIVMVLLMAWPAAAIDWHTANQSTVGWDAVTTLSDGSPLPATDTMEYTIYLANFNTDPNKTNPSEIETVAETEYTITLTEEGSYYVGLKAVRKVDGVKVSESITIWSDDPNYTQGGQTFGIRYYLPPANPGGMHP